MIPLDSLKNKQMRQKIDYFLYLGYGKNILFSAVMEVEYTKDRSKFWLKIYQNEDCITISTNEMVKNLISFVTPHLEKCSPKGWRNSRNYDDLFNLWIPNDCVDEEIIDVLKSWAEEASSHIWLKTNKNTNYYFVGTELDYCIASDWNYDFDSKQRTVVGEAEYKLKYVLPRGYISREQAESFAKDLEDAIINCINSLPFSLDEFIVTTIPAVKNKQNKLSWNLAEYVSELVNAEFMGITLERDKPQMKEQTVENKIKLWREIFVDKTMINLQKDIRGKNILIVDDLYQSGASIWCFAEFLKRHGANMVIGVTAVKARRDGDNI